MVVGWAVIYLKSIIVTAVLLITALYPTIWLHELAHSSSAFALGCKANWFETDMTLYLYRSFGGDIDYECLSEKGDWATSIVDGAGVAVNLVLMFFGCALAVVLRRIAVPALLAVFASAFAATNYIEAFSYLIVNTIFLRSDMVAIAHFLPVNILYLTAFSAITALLFFNATFRSLICWLNERYQTTGLASVLFVGTTICAVMAVGRSDLTSGAAPTNSSLSIMRFGKFGLELDEHRVGSSNPGHSFVLNSSRIFRVGNCALDIERLRNCRG